MSDNWYWYHLIATTYGAWLYGDSRGFRTRHHREHVEGDYKNPPPPGTYAALERRSRESMPQEPVVLPAALRPVVGTCILERLRGLGSLVITISVSGQHLHVLAKMPFGKPRRWMGLAKRHVWFELRDRHWQGKLWGKRSKFIPIKDRQHQLNTHRYILRHARQGAWVWSIEQEKQAPPQESTVRSGQPPSPGAAPGFAQQMPVAQKTPGLPKKWGGCAPTGCRPPHSHFCPLPLWRGRFCHCTPPRRPRPRFRCAPLFPSPTATKGGPSDGCR